MVDNVEFKIMPDTNRACAIKIKCGNSNILCINMYMPVDNQKKTTVDPEVIETLEAIDMFIEQCIIRNVILAADLNIDFNRKKCS